MKLRGSAVIRNTTEGSGEISENILRNGGTVDPSIKPLTEISIGTVETLPAGSYAIDPAYLGREPDMSTTVSYKGNTLTTVNNNTKTLETEGKYLEADIILTDVSQSTPTLQTKPVTYTPTTSQQTDQVTADNGYDGLQEVDVTINAVASGTEGTPTATKGAVSGNAVTVTPSVTNSAGYISGGTHTGTGVSVSASELVSGTYTVDSSGTKDVTNYASASVPSGTAGTPSATKSAVSNHAVTVTPSVTNSTGWIAGSTKTGTAVTVSASELVSGSETKTANGTYDVTNLAEIVVNVSGGTSKNTQVVQGTTRTASSTLTAIGAELTVSKTGTYDVYWSAFRSNTSSSYTFATQLYVGGSAYGSENTTWSNHVQNNHLQNVSLTKNQKIRVYGRESRGTSYYIYAPMLAIVEA